MMFRIFAFLILFSGLNSVQSKSLKYLFKHDHDTLPQVVDGVLDLSNFKLTSIEGIERYPGIDKVQGLILSNNKLRSIEPLSKLKKSSIVEIDLSCNKIKDFKFLAALPCLREANISLNVVRYNNLMFLLLKLGLNVKFEKDFVVGDEDDEIEVDPKEEGQDKKLKIIKIKKLNNADLKADDVCCICLSDDNLYATDCGHKYHKECLNRWIMTFKIKQEEEGIDKAAVKCPSCKQNLASHYNAILAVVKY